MSYIALLVKADSPCMKELADLAEPLRKKYGAMELAECLEGLAALCFSEAYSKDKKDEEQK